MIAEDIQQAQTDPVNTPTDQQKKILEQLKTILQQNTCTATDIEFYNEKIINIVEAKIKSDGLISSGSLDTGSHITSGSSSQIINDASNAIIRSIAPRLYSLQPFLLLSSRNPTIIANTTQLRIPINFQSNGTTRRLISTNIGINIMPPDMGFPMLLSASIA